VRPDCYATISTLAGELLAAHRSAGGLALLAALPPAEQEHYLTLAAGDGRKLPNPNGLLAEIAEIERTGVAGEIGRLYDVISSVSRAVRGLEYALVCALTIVGQTTDFDDAKWALAQSALTATTDDLEDRLAPRLVTAEPA
jgi:DNA-binding IclR family transcriptional regulator